jgi:hypothetical protein
MAERTIYRYVPRRRTQARLAGESSGPVKVVDQFPAGSKPARFNAWLAVKVTTGVGTMWCAYAFTAYRVYSAVTHGEIYGLMNFMAPGVTTDGSQLLHRHLAPMSWTAPSS